MAKSGVLQRVVREHPETFLREAARRAEGAGLPAFVEQEFRDFLACGVLARGFVRLRCDDCAFERLVPSRTRRLRVVQVDVFTDKAGRWPTGHFLRPLQNAIHSNRIRPLPAGATVRL